MRQVKVADLQIGDVMSRDAINRHAQVILAAGAVVETRHLTSLKAWGITDVYVCDAPALTSSEPSPNTATPPAFGTLNDVFSGDHPALREMTRLITERLQATQSEISTKPTPRLPIEKTAQVPAKWQRLTAENIASKASTLASLPSVYLRVNDVINKPSSSTSDIANALAVDQSLTFRLLRIANSAFYGFPRRIESVSDAVRIMGTRQLHDMVLATVVLKQFKGLDAELVNMAGFWRHSLACGIMARQIAVIHRESNIERFFLAGLLHDIGSLVIYQQLPERARVVLERHRATDLTIDEIERDVIGCDHAAVGKALMTEWRLPAYLRDIVAAHHVLEPRSISLGLAAVHFADFFTLGLGLGSNGEIRPPNFQPEAWETLGLSIPSLSPLATDTIQLLAEAERLFLGDEKAS